MDEKRHELFSKAHRAEKRGHKERFDTYYKMIVNQDLKFEYETYKLFAPNDKTEENDIDLIF